MSELDLDQLQSLRRLEACQKRLARYVREGRDYVVVIAHENTFVGTTPVENPGFVQFAWRDDLRLQMEVQGDHYRDEPYNARQRRRLTRLGYAPPFEHGDDFCNWTLFREAEGCQPESVAQLLMDSLGWVLGAHFHDIPTCLRTGVSHWKLEWLVSPDKRDIEAELRDRFNSN
jgi:hypothetical protein